MQSPVCTVCLRVCCSGATRPPKKAKKGGKGRKGWAASLGAGLQQQEEEEEEWEEFGMWMWGGGGERLCAMEGG